jgi:Fe-S oxidoreductase
MAVGEDGKGAVFWYGCNMTRHGELIRNSARLLGAVGIDAAPAGGPGHCCGSPKEASARIAGGMAERTVEKFNGMGAGDVITWCPSCHMNVQDFMAPVTAPVFTTSHISEILWERRERLQPLLMKAVGGRALIHMHHGFNGRVPVNTLVPGLLGMIPGLTVVESELRAPGHMCSAIAGVPGALADVQAAVLEAVAQLSADMVVTIFHSCHRELVTLERGRSIRVVNWIHLLADACGWTAEDEYKVWRNAADPRAAIGAARIEAAGEVAFTRLTEPELRRPALHDGR